jgi:hypothetical protein
MLHDDQGMMSLLKDGYELEGRKGPQDFQLGEGDPA